METTFGKTVETRLIHNSNNSLLRLNSIQNDMDLYQGNFKQQQQQRQFANLAQLELMHRRQLEQQQQQQQFERNSFKAPYTSILMRKNLKHLSNDIANPSSGGGYSSDSECCSKFNYHMSKAKIAHLQKLPITIPNQKDHDMDDNDDVRSCVSMRTQIDYNNNNNRYIDHSYMNRQANRYKSIDRQQYKYIRNQQATDHQVQNQYQQQYLNQSQQPMPNIINNPKLNPARIAQLLSPKVTSKQPANRNIYTNMTELDARIKNNNIKINQLLIQQQNTNRLNSNRCSSERQHHQTQQQQHLQQQDHVNLMKYLTWKNFNCNPVVMQNSELNDGNRTSVNNANQSYCSKSVSTPSTPLLLSSVTLPRRSRLNQELKVDTSSTSINHDKNLLSISQKQKDFEMKFKQFDRNIQQLNENFSYKINKTTTRSRSIPNKPDRLDLVNSLNNTSNQQSQIEVVPLENALLNMNEILKNLTLNALQKKDSLDFDCKSSNLLDKELSPPLSTSTSISFNANLDANTNNIAINNNIISNQTNISPMYSLESSSSTSESSSGVGSGVCCSYNTNNSSPVENSNFKSSFTVSTSTNSFSSSSVDAESIPAGSSVNQQVQSPINQVLTVRKNDISTQEQKPRVKNPEQLNIKEESRVSKSQSSLSFGKKLRRFLSLNSGSSKRQREIEEDLMEAKTKTKNSNDKRNK